MKTIVKHLAVGLSALILMAGSPPVDDKTKVIKALKSFVEAADRQDPDQLSQILDANFRAVVNRAFGSEEVSIMDKITYLDLIKQKKIGGDKREVSIIRVDITGNNACVHSVLKGSHLIFNTFTDLIRDSNGNWYVINDMPHIDKV
ncbi:MAG: nuclear transport factor 2 family protein [Vicingaceae bacterium]